mgnify:CR=1 FL=1
MFKRGYVSVAALALVLSMGCARAPEQSSAPDQSTVPAEQDDGVVRIIVDERGFTPSKVELPPDSTAVLEFLRTSEKTCATAVVFSDTGMRHELPLNGPVRVTIQPRDGQEIPFACAMNMYKGSIRSVRP